MYDVAINRLFECLLRCGRLLARWRPISLSLSLLTPVVFFTLQICSLYFTSKVCVNFPSWYFLKRPKATACLLLSSSWAVRGTHNDQPASALWANSDAVACKGGGFWAVYPRELYGLMIWMCGMGEYRQGDVYGTVGEGRCRLWVCLIVVCTTSFSVSGTGRGGAGRGCEGMGGSEWGWSYRYLSVRVAWPELTSPQPVCFAAARYQGVQVDFGGLGRKTVCP